MKSIFSFHIDDPSEFFVLYLLSDIFTEAKNCSVFVVDYLFNNLLIIIILESQNHMEFIEKFFPFSDSNSLIRLKERL